MKPRICMVVYSYYPKDVRVRKEAESLARNGYEVDVICLRADNEKKEEVVNRVNVYRLPMRTAREGGKLRYAYQYIVYFFLAAFVIGVSHLKKRYKIIHAHSMPDFIVFVATLPKMLGAKVVLDLHEVMPIIYLSRLQGKKSDMIYKFLISVEKRSTQFADAVITVADDVKEIFIEKGVIPNKIVIVCNVPDIKIMTEPSIKKNNKIVFAGMMNEYHDFETLLLAVNDLPGIELHIYGDGSLYRPVNERINELGLSKRVFLHGWVEQKELYRILPEYIAGVMPYIDVPSARISISNKAYDYIMSGLPVISIKSPSLLSVFDESCFYYYNTGDFKDLSNAISRVISAPAEAINKVIKSQNMINKRKLTWQETEKNLLDLYKHLSQED